MKIINKDQKNKSNLSVNKKAVSEEGEIDLMFPVRSGERQLNIIPLKKQAPGTKRKDRKRGYRISKRRVKKLSFKQKLIRHGVAGAAGISMTLAGLFGSPVDFTRQQVLNNLDPPGIEIVIEDENSDTSTDDRKQQEISPGRKGIFGRIADALRSLFMRLPVGIRMCVGVPLWAAGYAIIHVLSFLFGTFMTPVLRHLVEMLLIAVVLTGVFAVVMKSIFPNMPLKKILNKRNLTVVLLGAAIIKMADMVMPWVVNDYTRWKYLIMFGCGIVVLACITIPKVVRKHKRMAEG